MNRNNLSTSLPFLLSSHCLGCFARRGICVSASEKNDVFIPLQPLFSVFPWKYVVLSSAASCKLRKKLHIICKIKESYFWFAPPSYPWDRTSSNNSPPPGPKGWTCLGSCWWEEVVTGRVEPCISPAFGTKHLPPPHHKCREVIHEDFWPTVANSQLVDNQLAGHLVSFPSVLVVLE